MKKFYSLCALCALSFIPSSVMATVLLNEHFNQATETLSTSENAFTYEIAATGWTNINGSGQIHMSSTNLSYSGYKSTADETGGAVEYKATFGKKAATPLSSNINSGSIYAAAIMNISAVGGTGRDYNFALCTGTSSLATATNQFARINIRQGTSSGFRIAISKGAEANTLFLRWSDDLAFGTYLVVVEYQFISGDNNDVVKLYMNPVKGDKPKPTLTCVQDTIRESDSRNFGASQVADASGLQSAMLYSSSSNKAAMLIDELKVVTDWADLWEAGDEPGGDEPGGGDDPEQEPITKPEPAASDVTVNSATISWDAVEGADSYVLHWKKSSAASYGSNIPVVACSYEMSGLESGTTYNVQVKTVIGENESDWSEVVEFTTDVAPDAITYKDITFNKYEETNNLPTSGGNYYLTNNITLSSNKTITGDLKLCLNGHNIYTETNRIIVDGGATLTLYNNESEGLIYGGVETILAEGGIIDVEDGGTLIIPEGRIENIADASYGSYAVLSTGTLKISGSPELIGESASIYLYGTGKVITIEEGKPLTNTTPYAVNSTGQTITSGWANMDGANPCRYFTSAKTSYPAVVINSGEVKLMTSDVKLIDSSDNGKKISDNQGVVSVLAMTRSFTSAQYNTICLPFALGSDKMTEIFGLGYDLEEFVSSSMDGDVLSLTFAPKYSLEAGKPYLLKPQWDIINPTFENVTISVEEPVDNTEDTYISFHGTFSPTELTGGNKNLLFLGAGNELFWPESTGNLKGFRAYFEVKGDARKAVSARITKKTDHTTGIDQTTNDKRQTTNKILRNGQLLILQDGKTYNVLGIECK